jgi:putative flippase GtrA
VTKLRNANLYLQFGKFLMTGLLNTGFGYAVFAVFLALGLSSSTALFLATAGGALFNYHSTKSLVFGCETMHAWSRFLLLYVAVYVVNIVLLVGMERVGLKSLLAQGILALPIALISFTGQKVFVFKSEASA